MGIVAEITMSKLSVAKLSRAENQGKVAGTGISKSTGGKFRLGQRRPANRMRRPFLHFPHFSTLSRAMVFVRHILNNNPGHR
jgi:hypothetical protein